MVTIYSYRMAGITKTTVYLDAAAYRWLKLLAQKSGRTAAELVREAVAEYASRHTPTGAMPKSVGAGRSGRGDVSERAEDLLEGFGAE